MIKEALEYIISLRKPEITDINGETYSDKTLMLLVCHTYT